MPLPSHTGGTAHIEMPWVYARASGGVSTLRWRLAGNAADLDEDGHSFTLRSHAGVVVFEDDAPTIDGDSLSVTVPPLTDYAFGDGYTEEWTPSIGGVARTFLRPAVIARQALNCPVTQLHLERRHRNLAQGVTRGAPLQDFIDDAWADVVRRLITSGTWPDAIVDTDSLVAPTRARALELFFRDASRGGDTVRFTELARTYASEYASEWSRVTFRRDVAGDGVVDEARRPAAKVLHRGGAPRGRFWRVL